MDKIFVTYCLPYLIYIQVTCNYRNKKTTQSSPCAFPIHLEIIKQHFHPSLKNSISILICMACTCNRPRSIYQYSSMAPRLSGQNCKFFKFLLSSNSQKRLRYKHSSLTRKPRSHVRILIYRTWPIAAHSPHNLLHNYYIFLN